MAEALGFAVGVVTLIGLFKNTVEYFESVQLDRAFGKDFQDSQLRLDIARLRLSRWGKSLSLEDDVRDATSLQQRFGSEANVKHAEALLGQILDLFADAEGVSNKYRSRAEPQDGNLAVYDPKSDMDPAMGKLHEKMRRLAIERQNRSGIRQKAKWALYQKKQFRRLIENITKLVNDLETLFPATQQTQRELCDIEVSAIGEGQDISALREIAAAQDKLLEQAITEAVKNAEESHHIAFSGSGNTGLQLGHNSGTVSGFTIGRDGWREIQARSMHLLDEEKFKATESDYDIQHEEDRMSVQSVESSTTLISTFSDSTVVAKSATVELEKVFQEDKELINLYQLVLKDTSMEPERLQRNVARLLQFFAKDLRREAGGQLERVASRFVQSKAQYIAQCIVERFYDTPRGVIQQQTTSYKEDEEHGKTGVGVLEAQHPVNNERVELDDMEEEAPVDEDYFEDLAVLRGFLVNSSAFQIFRARLTKFVLPKELYPSDVDSSKDRSTDAPLLKIKHMLSSTPRVLEYILVLAGCLEPPLQPGFIRLRWQCECGAPLFGDVQEYRIGGVSRLMERMEKSTGGKVTATSYNKGSPNQQYIPGPIIWVREMAKNITKAFSRDGKRNDTLPQHNDPSTTVTPASPDIESPIPRDLLLLACMHESQGGQLLHQDSIGSMSNDRQLFCFIREQISRAPSKHWLSRLVKTVIGIHFTQFHLRLNDDVEPRLHKLCCRKDACQCVPLTSNDEYDCTPAGPLDFGPPVLPSKMLHYFQHPDLISEKETSILNQLPKRNCGKLASTGRAPAAGWGLYYEESWNLGLMIAVFVGMTICASLVFGVWWTLAEADIQGAWGVSSYMITACALVVGLVSMVGRG